MAERLSSAEKKGPKSNPPTVEPVPVDSSEAPGMLALDQKILLSHLGPRGGDQVDRSIKLCPINYLMSVGAALQHCYWCGGLMLRPSLVDSWPCRSGHENVPSLIQEVAGAVVVNLLIVNVFPLNLETG